MSTETPREEYEKKLHGLDRKLRNLADGRDPEALNRFLTSEFRWAETDTKRGGCSVHHFTRMVIGRLIHAVPDVVAGIEVILDHTMFPDAAIINHGKSKSDERLVFERWRRLVGWKLDEPFRLRLPLPAAGQNDFFFTDPCLPALPGEPERSTFVNLWNDVYARQWRSLAVRTEAVKEIRVIRHNETEGFTPLYGIDGQLHVPESALDRYLLRFHGFHPIGEHANGQEAKKPVMVLDSPWDVIKKRVLIIHPTGNDGRWVTGRVSPDRKTLVLRKGYFVDQTAGVYALYKIVDPLCWPNVNLMDPREVIAHVYTASNWKNGCPWVAVQGDGIEVIKELMQYRVND